MKLIIKIVGAVLFILIFGLALHNMEIVALRSFLGYELKGPLVLFLFGFFVLGFVFGVIAMTPTVFRHRRELSRHKKDVLNMQKESEIHQRNRTQPPQPDSIVTQ